jgi:chemotaxis protein MotD
VTPNAPPRLVAPAAPPVPAGGLVRPHELAQEIGARVHMAVREGGRELVVNLRPADLGRLTIRVTMTDGVMHAQILADRPEAARMLQGSLGNLGSALGELGYSLDSLDVSYGGQGSQDPRDASSSTRGSARPVRGEVIEADGTPALTTTSTGRGTSSRLDLLA